MPAFKVWDIVAVPFRYTGHTVRQRRPALVVACPPTDDGPGLLWLLMITAAAHRRWSGDVLISDLAAAGLPATSIVRPGKIATNEAKDADVVGMLPPVDRAAVASFLTGALGQALA